MHNGFFSPEVFPILCISVVGVTAVVIFGVGNLFVKLARTITDYRLKSQMLDRGMSPLEIEQVLRAQSIDFEDLPKQVKHRILGKSDGFLAGRF